MQTEWSPGRDDEQGSERDAPTPATASPVDGRPTLPVSDRVDVGAIDAAGRDAEDDAGDEVDHDGTEAADSMDPVPTDVVEESVQAVAAPVDATSEADEEAHRTAVDEVDALLDEVELALSRLDDGTYGRCESCGAVIADAQLAEQPLVRACASCSAASLQPEVV